MYILGRLDFNLIYGTIFSIYRSGAFKTNTKIVNLGSAHRESLAHLQKQSHL